MRLHKEFAGHMCGRSTYNLGLPALLTTIPERWRLRAHLQSTPVAALSATLAPNVLGYIHKPLLLSSPTILFRETIGRSNVTLAIIPLQEKPESSLHELDFLVDPAVEAAFSIQRTFVIVDNVDSAHHIVQYLRGWPTELRTRCCEDYERSH